MRIRGGYGLGDSIYVQSVARYLAREHQVEVCSDWPDVFRQLDVRVVPFSREKIDLVAHYSMRRRIANTDQFEDCWIQAGIREPIVLRLGWRLVRPELKSLIQRPAIAVAMPRAPFGRIDGFGMELLPDCRVIQRAIDRLRGKAQLILLGKGNPLFRFSGIDLDLTNKTSICDLLDLASLCDGFLGYCSFFVPLAESLSRPALLVWSRRGLQSRHEVVRRMTPKKVLHRASSRFVMDDCSNGELAAAVDALFEQARSRLPL